MKKVKVFEVVKMRDGDKATILGINNNNYIAEIIDNNGISKGTKTINQSDIAEIIISKNK